MSFVTPWLLAGSAFIAVPVILHFVMRQRPQQLEFPALRFVRARRETNQRQLKLRHLLLLLLRIAAILLFAAALARPSIEGSGMLGGQEAPVAAVLLVDTAPHMDYRQAGKTRLDEARELADWLLTQLPGESRIAVLDGRTREPQYAVDLGAAKQRVERLRIAPSSRTLPGLLDSAVSLLQKSELQRREIYLFTDLSQGAWQDTTAEVLREKLSAAEDVGLYVIDVGVEKPRDYGLAELQLSQQTLAKNSTLAITANIRRLGPQDSRSVVLYALDENGKPTARDRQDILWPADGEAKVEFLLANLQPGLNQGYVEIEGEDSLAWNNRRYFSVQVKSGWDVLLAAAEPENALFLTEAIAPEAFRKSGRSRFQPDVIDIEQLDEQRLEDYSAVCLLDPPPLEELTWKRIVNYTKQGGAVGLFLGRNARPEAFNRKLPQELLPGKLAAVAAEQTYLTSDDLFHPVLSRFREMEGSVPWQAFPVFQYWKLTDTRPTAQVILRYASGAPALLESQLGKGRVLAMTTPLSDAKTDRRRQPWNVLATGIEPWPFFILSNEMMLYLVDTQQGQANYFAGEAVVLRLDALTSRGMASVRLPSGEYLRQPLDPAKRTLEITSTETPGNYQVRVQRQVQVQGLAHGFSVNTTSQATSAKRMELARLDELLGKDRYQRATSRDEIDRDVNIGRVGRELFPLLILLVAIVLVAEHLLANRFYREKNEPA